MAPIVAGNVDDGEELLAHPLGIVLQQRSKEEELLLWHKVLLDDQEGARSSSLTGCGSHVTMY